MKENKGDLISREALKKAITEHCRNETECLNHFWYDENIIALIDNAPTVADHSRELVQKSLELGRNVGFFEGKTETAKEQARAKQGKWIPNEETYTDLSGTIETYTRFKCDQCLQGQNFGPYPFCPWCGSKMTPEISEETTI